MAITIVVPAIWRSVAVACLAAAFSSNFVPVEAARPPAATRTPVSAHLKMELQQVDSALTPERGRGKILEPRIQELVDELRVLYVALPKNEHGKLGAAAARYALHRFFRRTRSWLVRGIAPNGLAWNTSDPTTALHGESPESVELLFQKHFQDADSAGGLSLEEAALLAATVEEQIFQEANERLKLGYHAMGLPFESGSSVTWEQAEEVIDLTLMSYHQGMMKHPTVFESPKKRAQITKIYPNWEASREFYRVVLRDEVPRVTASLEFPKVKHVVRVIIQRFGHWQQSECALLKNAIVAREGECLGHVPLVDFYSSAVNDGKWQFAESPGYLRALGALDESDPDQPNVIVANYIEGPSNLVGESRMHSIVCQDECEPIMMRLEAGLQWPSTTPAEIVTLVNNLMEERKLSLELIRRLDDVAKPHEGRVLIHGRLFAQWLHHVFPRECAYPQRSGSTTPVNPSQYWGKLVESLADMKRDTDSLKKAQAAHGKGGALHECPAWATEEELVDPLAPIEQLSAAELSSPILESQASLMQAALLVGCLFIFIMAVAAASRIWGRMSGGPKPDAAKALQAPNLIIS